MSKPASFYVMVFLKKNPSKPIRKCDIVKHVKNLLRSRGEPTIKGTTIEKACYRVCRNNVNYHALGSGLFAYDPCKDERVSHELQARADRYLNHKEMCREYLLNHKDEKFHILDALEHVATKHPNITVESLNATMIRVCAENKHFHALGKSFYIYSEENVDTRRIYDKVIDYIRDNPRSTIPEVAQALGMSYERAANTVYKARTLGYATFRTHTVYVLATDHRNDKGRKE